MKVTGLGSGACSVEPDPIGLSSLRTEFELHAYRRKQSQEDYVTGAEHRTVLSV